ncbi:MAG: Wzz/FepE/Etk N-terminal domain-containing protein [Proteobacteria bacterium]|nr:Wzz/FepE/Etk N-terminal domain-containing protein [Pseudomonadota bacterium]
MDEETKKIGKIKGIKYNEDEIDLIEIYSILKKYRKKILLFVFAVVSLTVGISFLMTPIYEATAVLAPSNTQSNPSFMTAFASQLGIITPQSPELSEVVALLKSKVLQERVIKKYNLIDVFFEKDDLKDKTEDEKVWEALRFFEDNLKVNYKQKDNLVQVSMQFKDPKMSADIVNFLIQELKEHMSEEMKRVAKTNKMYLESQLNKTMDPFIRAKIYNLIANQIEQSMLAEAKENFSFKVIDPPKPPDKKVKPKRALMGLISLLASLIIGIFYAFVKEYFENLKSGGALDV